MTEKDQIHTLLADLAGEDPPVDIDLDRQIQRGRRRGRWRTASFAVAAVAVPAVLVSGFLAFRPDNGRSDAPVADPGTPWTTAKPPSVRTTTLPPGGKVPGGKQTSASTEKSRALRAQFVALVPEIADTPGGRLFDMEFIGGPRSSTHAGADWQWPDGNQVTVDIVVGRRGNVPPECTGTTGSTPCTEVRHLPDGSIAYLHTYTVWGGDGHAYAVRLDRADGVSVSVSSAAQKPKGAKHDAPLSLKRVLEIAQKVTVKP
jgi:hypothetical protein